MNCSPPGTSVHGESPGKNIGVGCHGLLHVIFPTQGLNPGLPYCRWILYHLRQQASPRILEWVAYPFSYPFSMWTSWPRNQTGISCIAGRFFTNWATREPKWDYIKLNIFCIEKEAIDKINRQFKECGQYSQTIYLIGVNITNYKELIKINSKKFDLKIGIGIT